MKNILTILVLLLFAQVGAFAQQKWHALHPSHDRLQQAQSAGKIADHHDLPDMSYQLNWNIDSSAWDGAYHTTYTYSSTGLLLEAMHEEYLGSVFQPSVYELYTYNAQDLPHFYTYRTWNGSAWENQYQSEYKYDPFGNSTFDMSYGWNGVQWDSASGRRSNLSYVFTDKIAQEVVEYWDPQSQWTRGDSSVYHWPSAQGWDTVTYAYWAGNSWSVEERILVNGWHNVAELLPDFAAIQTYNGSTWEDDERLMVTYGPYDSQDWVYEEWDTMWTPYSREIYNYDSLEHEVLFEDYKWSGQWELEYGTTSDYTYDGQGRTTEIIVDESNLGIYEHRYRIVFISFFTSAPEPVKPQVHVQAYPNPCTDHLSFSMDLNQNGPVQIALYDLQGRLRVQSLSPKLTDKQMTVPISETLENGTYLYRISTKEGQATGKVVVQH